MREELKDLLWKVHLNMEEIYTPDLEILIDEIKTELERRDREDGD